MSEAILGVRRADGKIYQLNESTWAWVEFPSQPLSAGLASGLWGGPGNTIWAHNGVSTVSLSRYQYYDGATWSEVVGPDVVAGTTIPRVIHGNEDGTIVYAALSDLGGNGEVHKWTAATGWQRVVSGWRAGCIWCDSTGQYVWATSGEGSFDQNIRYSSDYGASWTNKMAQLISDMGASIGNNPRGAGVWGLSPTEVYVDTGWALGGPTGAGGLVAKWNGSSFVLVSESSTYQTLLECDLWTDGTAIITSGQTSSLVMLRNVSGSMNVAFSAANHYGIEGRGVMGREGVIVGVLEAGGGQIDIHKYSTDDGVTWNDITVPWTPGQDIGIQGMTLYGWVIDTPPYLSDQSPAPGTTHLQPNTPVLVAIRDEQGDLVLSSVRIYLNGTLAWKGGNRLGGFYGDIEAVTSDAGYLFELTPAEWFEPGVQTVRVVAEDEAALALDETYTFATVAYVPMDDEQELQEPEAGFDLWLDASRDVSVANHDLELVAGVDEVVQHLLVGLRLFLAEWYLDESAGIPYYRHIFTDAPNSRVIEGIFRQSILGDDDIEAMDSFGLTYNRGTRALSVDFRATSRVGPVDVSAVFP